MWHRSVFKRKRSKLQNIFFGGGLNTGKYLPLFGADQSQKWFDLSVEVIRELVKAIKILEKEGEMDNL